MAQMSEPITLEGHVKRSGHAEAAELEIVITQLAVAWKIIAR